MSFDVKGKIFSFQSLGGVDGPGIRNVVFFQGCDLRCGYCHNPESWDKYESSGYWVTVSEIYGKISRYKEYFGANGGVTLSGGEPLLQPEFVLELAKLCKLNGINVALDTSGSFIPNNINQILENVDLIILDIKFNNDKDLKQYVGGISIQHYKEFLNILNTAGVKTKIRQVIVPGINDSNEEMQKLVEFCSSFNCIYEIELLPFQNLCKEKYTQMGIPFKFSNYNSPSQQEIENLQNYVNTYKNYVALKK